MIFKNTEFILLKLLMNHESLTLKQISFFLKKSDVTSQSTIKNLSNFLKKTKIGKIETSKNKYSVSIKTNLNLESLLKNTLKYYNYSLSAKERIDYILCLLIFEKDFIVLNNLCQIFNITRSAIATDLRELKKKINAYNLIIISQPWKGIKLLGDEYDLECFAIEYLTKILYEKEFNEITWAIYTICINPLIVKYAEKNKWFDKLELFTPSLNKIISVFNLRINHINHVGCKALFLYQFLRNEPISDRIYLKINQFHINVQSKYQYILNKFIEMPELLENDFLKTNVLSIAHGLLLLTNEYYLHLEDPLMDWLEKRIVEIYSIEFDDSDRIILAYLIVISKLKLNFSIQNNENYYITQSAIPKSILDDLKYSINKKNIYLMEEDVYLIAIFIYQTVCNRYFLMKKNIKILLCDSSFKNWLGTNLIIEMKKYIPFIEVDIISVNSQDCWLNIDMNDYQYILATSVRIQNLLLKKNKELKTTLIVYADYFEINSFWGHLFFGKSIKK